MFDFIQGFGKSADEKRTEALNAYLDGALSPRDRQQLEASLQQDAALRAQLEQMRRVRLALTNMPRRRVPRSFSLDPALYGPPKRQPAQQLYPLLRGATALTALLFIFVLGLGALNLNRADQIATPAETVTMAEPAAMLVTVPAAELELEAAPQAATAAMAIEEAASDEPSEGVTSETTIPEELALGASDSVAMPEADGQASADLNSRKEFSSTAEALATASVAQLDSYTAAGVAANSVDDQSPETDSATTAAFALPPEEPLVATGLPFATIAIALGLTTLALAALTLLARRRAGL